MFILVAFLASGTKVLAQWTNDRSVNTPVCVASGTQSSVKIASDESGGAIFAWNDSRTGTSNVYLQHLNKNGFPQWTANGIPIHVQGAGQTLVDIFSDGSGGAIVGWIDNRDTSAAAYLQRINSSGVSQWSVGGVPAAQTGAVALASSATGDMLLSWSSAGDIYAQKVDISGVVQWGPSGVMVCNDPNLQKSPVIVSADGGAIVAWSDGRANRGSIFCQILDQNGSILWTPNGGVVDSTLPPPAVGQSWQIGMPRGIASDTIGGAIILYDKVNLFGTAGVKLAFPYVVLYCTKMSSAGTIQWGPTQIETKPYILNERIVSDQSGGAVITFDMADMLSPSRVRAKRVSANGVILWSTVSSIFATSASTATYDNSGGFTFLYASYSGLPGPPDIYSQHINALGAKDSQLDLPASIATGNQGGPVAVSNGLNGVIVAWSDGRLLGDQNIYTQNVPGVTVPRNDITVRNSCTGQQTLTFGQYPTATDVVDLSLGEASLPPPPPTGVFDARFVLPSLASSWKDFRNDTLKAISWRMTFQPGSCGYPMTFSWDTVSLTGGSYYLRDEVTGTIVNVNMKLQSSYTLSIPGITSLQIIFSRNVSKQVTYPSGWSLVSVPVLQDNMNVSASFPLANPIAYGYNNGYVATATLNTGGGYWLEFTGNSNCFFSGPRVVPSDIAMSAGWNIVGPFDVDADVGGITTTPPGIIVSNFYGYSSGYTNATTLSSGKGYWVETSQAGTLHLPAGSLSPLARLTRPTESQMRFEFADSKGSKASVYLAKAEEIIGPQGLPPVPPSGILDVRYATDTQIEQQGRGRYEVHISSAVYPLQISASNLQGQSFKVLDAIDGTILNQSLAEGGKIMVTLSLTRLILEEDGNAPQVPVEFGLSQNYPNPFNPTTKIKFALPVASKVKLSVFNILGEKVSDLIDHEYEAGYHQADFNASAIASGVYFYRIDASGFTSVKKLMILK